MPDQQQTDHDLLIRVDQKVDGLIDTIDKLQNGTVSDINSLKRDKADRKDVEILQQIINTDIEKRLRSVEGRIAYIYAWSAGAAAIVALIIDMLSRFYGFGK